MWCSSGHVLDEVAQAVGGVVGDDAGRIGERQSGGRVEPRVADRLFRPDARLEPSPLRRVAQIDRSEVDAHAVSDRRQRRVERRIARAEVAFEADRRVVHAPVRTVAEVVVVAIEAQVESSGRAELDERHRAIRFVGGRGAQCDEPQARAVDLVRLRRPGRDHLAAARRRGSRRTVGERASGRCPHESSRPRSGSTATRARTGVAARDRAMRRTTAPGATGPGDAVPRRWRRSVSAAMPLDIDRYRGRCGHSTSAKTVNHCDSRSVSMDAQ